MEPGPGLSPTILDYHTLLQHSISSNRALPSEPRVQSSGPPPSVMPTAASLIVGNSNGRDLLVADVMGSLGPGGCGLLAVRGVPEVPILRKRLLPLAKKLALMPDAIRRPVLKNYDLTADVPLKRADRPVSAFATKLRYARHSHAADGSCIMSPLCKSSPGCLCDVSSSKDLSRESENLVSREDSDLEQLGSIVRQLGACMVEVGLLVARLCDSFVSGADLEDAILESGSAKARLIHYHAHSEKDLLFHPAKIGSRCTKKGTKTMREFGDSTMSVRQNAQAVRIPANPCTALGNAHRIAEELWQEWHYDYGILTVFTAPMFLSSPSLGSISSIRDCESYPSGHTGLRVFSRGVDNFVCVPPDCLIVQVGEAAQIASGGKLAAVAHCVGRPPAGQMEISRETFVTFLQPSWDRVLRPPIGVTREEVLNLEPFNKCRTICRHIPDENLFSQASARANNASEQHVKFFSVVPSLDSRWKAGCTFAEFSRETTALYYGVHGRQSQRTSNPVIS